MHISLDSALGRQRRLNSVGESVLQIAPNAAAAYSLRSLTGGDPKVVRVRRGSDNHEQDFTASEVSSGALTSFVNAQVVAPLDIQELSATGRDGDFLIAKAAYSLRSLGTRQATLAATGDTVARADGKFVAQVRRSSDDALKSFTADEVTNGTLLAFVNEDVTIYQSDFSAGIDGFTATSTTTATGNQDGVSDSAGTSKDNVLKVVKASDSQAYLQRDQGVVAGLTYTVSGSFFAPSANTAVDGIMIKDGLAGSSLSDYPSGYLTSDGTWTDFSFSYTATTSGNQRVQLGISSLGSNPNGSSTGSTGDIVYIADLKFVETTSNGFVKTWYDQSVTNQAGDTATGNHAVQATAAEQPKIVNAGSLLNELDFDGTDDSFDIDFGADLLQANSLFMVHQSDSLSSNSNDFFDRISGSPRTLLDQSGSNYRMLSPSSAGTGVAVTTDKSLVFALYNGSSSLFAKNGTAISALDAGTQDINQNSSLGSSGSNFYNGSMQEFIVYNSDQTDNRIAIEANIGEAYGIDLPSGVDPGFDQVDGFVDTWYDQSGNSNNVVQATAGSQPKIVNAGNLIDGGLRFDDAQKLETAGTFSFASGTTLSTFITNKSDGDEAAYLFRFVSDYIVYNTAGGVRRVFAGTNANSGTLGSDEELWTTISALNSSGGTANFFADGTLVSSADANIGTKEVSSKVLNIGGSSSSNHWNGTVNEVILYATDQTSNRAALDANIISHYGIS